MVSVSGCSATVAEGGSEVFVGWIVGGKAVAGMVGSIPSVGATEICGAQPATKNNKTRVTKKRFIYPVFYHPSPVCQGEKHPILISKISIQNMTFVPLLSA